MVQVATYDEGNAFARLMLAELGQMHIEGTVTLRDDATKAVVGEYEVSKTFAWGGVYGASTKIEQVQGGFAESVAAVIAGSGRS
jgi:hypothetical protein